MIKKKLLKYLLLCVVTLAIVWSSPLGLLAGTLKNHPKQQQAQRLVTIGREQLNQGQPGLAFNSWQEAAKLYSQLNDQEGITASLVYQNFALQKLGLHSQACDKLVTALKLTPRLCKPTILPTPTQEIEKLTTIIKQIQLTPANLLALQNLGEVLRLNYKLSESETVLKQILATKNIPPEQASNILLSLGNTNLDIYKRTKYQYKWIDEPLLKDEFAHFIPKKAQEAINNYQLLGTTADTPKNIKIQARLNYLDLLLDFQEWLKLQPNSIEIYTKINQQIQPLINLILQEHSAFSSLPPEHSIQARLKFANSLSKIQDQEMHSEAIKYAQDAFQMSKSLNNQNLEAKTLKVLGELKPEKSLEFFETALTLAQSIHAEDIAYKLQALLSKLYQKQGKIEAALQAYRAAIDNITNIRSNLLSSNYDSQFFFYEEVDPIYRSYINLITSSAKPDLDLIIQIHNQLQTAELEDYLKCGKLDLVSLNEVQNLNTASAIIHIIDLNDTIEVIIKSPGKQPHHHSVNANLVRSHVNALLKILQDKRLPSTKERVIISHSQLIYKKLIAPLEQYLPNSGTLVFVLDKSFQSLPMQILHDGQDYLLNRYSFSYTLGAKIAMPKLLPKEKMQALIAGLSVPSPSLKDINAPPNATALPQVREEIEDVKKLTRYSLTLLDKEFTSNNFKEKFSRKNFPIVHISTHGQFSSDLTRTGFLAYDRQINISEFDSLLRNKARISPQMIELLVLSACQTAKGNKKSALGIAGVAVQTGARSTVASLWLVEAESTVLLMQELYRGLNNDLTKAEALRQAQISLKSHPKYSHPYFWTPFILVGSWL